jgi:hypothetical protein
VSQPYAQASESATRRKVALTERDLSIRRNRYPKLVSGPWIPGLAPLIILLDLVRKMDREKVSAHGRVVLGDLLSGLLLGGVDVVLVPLLDAVEQGAVSRLSSS